MDVRSGQLYHEMPLRKKNPSATKLFMLVDVSQRDYAGEGLPTVVRVGRLSNQCAGHRVPWGVAQGNIPGFMRRSHCMCSLFHTHGSPLSTSSPHKQQGTLRGIRAIK